MSIPKQINQIWLQGADQLPSKYSENVKSVIDKNPGYGYKLWDEKSLREVIAQIGPQYLEKFDSLPLLHQKVDFGRYALLYQNGGISVDMDVVALKGFDSLPEINTGSFIVSRNSLNNFINNATILVEPKHPVMKGLLDYILTLDCKQSKGKFFCVQQTTGPQTFTRYLKNFKDQITILPSTYFESCSGNDEYCQLSPDAILNHLHDGTWLPGYIKKGSKALYFCREYKWIIVLLIIIIIILIAKFR